MTQSLLTVLTPASSRALTTLATVKDEIDAGPDDTDARLSRWIAEESERIETYLGRALAEEVLQETFRLRDWANRLTGAPGHLRLTRRPVTAIASIDVDGITLATGQYEADAGAGLLYRLHDDRRVWWCGRTVVARYTAGYASIGTLPRPIEAACLALIRHRWAARGRDPMLRSLAIPGVATEQYWVGATGEDGDMPPEIAAMLDPFRNVPL
jgi:hypothetical protein